MKVVKNACFGGFGLSEAAIDRLREITGKTSDETLIDYSYCSNEIRSAPELVQMVEELGDKASDWAAKLVVVEIPDDIDWYIEEYDGYESVVEAHREW